jgi:hypothetical protein
MIVDRRKFLFETGAGLAGLGLTSLLHQEGLLAAAGENPFAPRATHFAPRAKAVISLFLSGGLSQMDSFDRKPMLEKFAGQPLMGKGEVVVRQGYPGPLMPSPFTWQRHGQSGLEISEIFPHIGRQADSLAVIRSVVGRSNDHVMAAYELASGSVRMGAPCVGSWITYGLGTVNQDLPAFVVIYDARGGPFGGPSNWSAGYMPAVFQGTIFKSAGDPIVDLKPKSGDQPDGCREESREFGIGGAHQFLRTGLSHARQRTASGGSGQRNRGDPKALRHG